MAHMQKPHFFFRRNGRVHLNQQGHPFSRLLAAEVHASAVVMLDIPCSEVVWRVLATHSFASFPLHFPSCATLCAIIFQLDSTSKVELTATVHSKSITSLLLHFSYTWSFQEWVRTNNCEWLTGMIDISPTMKFKIKKNNNNKLKKS